ncbi:MAG: hypothetical protein WBC30_16595 [Candidatus Sulfotelmatobacter sp.]
MLKVHFSSRPAAGVKRILASTTVAFCLIAGFVPAALAQKSPRVARKVVSEVKPAYPATLKNLHIEGLVRLTVTVLPNGNVASINVRG